jgi:hypothetical protein
MGRIFFSKKSIPSFEVGSSAALAEMPGKAVNKQTMNPIVRAPAREAGCVVRV